jgi:hypothetical protein
LGRPSTTQGRTRSGDGIATAVGLMAGVSVRLASDALVDPLTVAILGRRCCPAVAHPPAWLIARWRRLGIVDTVLTSTGLTSLSLSLTLRVGPL